MMMMMITVAEISRKPQLKHDKDHCN